MSQVVHIFFSAWSQHELWGQVAREAAQVLKVLLQSAVTSTMGDSLYHKT